jgi:hypothetical protein
LAQKSSLWHLSPVERTIEWCDVIYCDALATSFPQLLPPSSSSKYFIGSLIPCPECVSWRSFLSP